MKLNGTIIASGTLTFRIPEPDEAAGWTRLKPRSRLVLAARAVLSGRLGDRNKDHMTTPLRLERAHGGWVVVNRAGWYGVFNPKDTKARATQNYDEATRFAWATVKSAVGRCPNGGTSLGPIQAIAWDDKLRATEYHLGWPQ